jgi:hypothetical protein
MRLAGAFTFELKFAAEFAEFAEFARGFAFDPENQLKRPIYFRMNI